MKIIRDKSPSEMLKDLGNNGATTRPNKDNEEKQAKYAYLKEGRRRRHYKWNAQIHTFYYHRKFIKTNYNNGTI